LLVIAHRTCPKDTAENSLAGLRIAAQQGADGVEIDLRMSLDQRPFLMHDNTLRRTVGLRLPLELTPSFIVHRLRVRQNGMAIPTLADVLAALPPELLLAVDVKTPWAVGPLLTQVRPRGLQPRVLVWCQSARAVAWYSRGAPEAEVAYLKTALDPAAKSEFIETAVVSGARAISAHWLAIDAEFVAAAHARGLKVYSWHEEHELTPEKLRSGLDGLITDYPRKAREAAEAHGS